VHVYTRMRGALSARTILTRSHVCAGVSVRLCFSWPRFASVVVHFRACGRTLRHVHTCTCVRRVRACFSQRALRFAPRLILTLRAWPSACSKIKCYFREILPKISQKFPKLRKFGQNCQNSTFGRVSHTRNSRAHNTMYMCASMHVQACTQPRDVCGCGQNQRI